MEENKSCSCGCGCDCEDEEAEIIVFEDENGKEESFEVIGVFEVEEKEYIALQSQDDSSILLCKYIEKENGDYEVEEIESDEEFNKVSDAFDALVEEEDEE
ncbi:hypothetical protein HMPREF3188_00127 [Tissierellia bacterium KA00581]|jgi:hypothetical protein|nr:hypothetical protein HMPREF3188_00127 [Tissierellia bacterium KA00581]